MEELVNSALELASHSYGNYVMQHIIQYGTNEQKDQIISQIKPKIVELSMHKFASNVAENCFKYGSPAQRDELVHQMLYSQDSVTFMENYSKGNPIGKSGKKRESDEESSSSDSQSPKMSDELKILKVLIKDKYGNYVV